MVLGAIHKSYSMTRNYCDFVIFSLRAISLLADNIMELFMEMQPTRQDYS